MSASYRIQLTAELGFDEVIDALDHMVALGVSHVYLSPILEATPGSTHGYDVVDVRKIDTSRGGRGGFERLVAAARERGLGIIVDIVPNHMAAHPANAAWWDVLRNGQASTFADWFDIRWEQGNDHVADRLLLPVLGDDLDVVLEERSLTIEHDTVRYGDMFLPLAPGTDAPGSDDPAAVRGLLDRQHYELVHWRRGNEELDRRRFFDVTELVGVRQEDPRVRDATHELILELCDAGLIDGLRVDHPDGLADPTGYVQWLRARLPDHLIVVEKILAPDEELPTDWPVDGTTGYERSALIDRLAVDPDAGDALDSVVAEHTGQQRDFTRLALESTTYVLRVLFGSECRYVGNLAAQVLDVDPDDGRAAVQALAVSLPVYRTYVRRGEAAGAVDRHHVRDAAVIARGRVGDDVEPLVDALVAVFDDPQRSEVAEELVLRFQQLTAAATAKGTEDTALYRFPRLLTLDEVGADPTLVGIGVDDFHDDVVRTSGLLALSTHDSKRSGDARHRLAVLSEVPTVWASAARRIIRRLDDVVGTEDRDPVVELALVQMALAADPIDADRLRAAAEKAAREAKRSTSWLKPREDHESVLQGVVDALVHDAECRLALEDVLAVIVPEGRSVSLAATLLQLTLPGIPDLYQGSEGWQLALADPDNRRPPDLAARHRIMEGARPETWTPEALATDALGCAKAFLIRSVLPQQPAPDAPYVPVRATGPAASHVVSFLRGDRHLTVTSRLRLALAESGGWRGTAITLPEGTWTDVLTQRSVGGGERSVESLLGPMPAAYLVADR